jgi:pilus assembly protein Flp/PilA
MRAFWSGETGITSIEYGLIAALIAIALMVSMIMASTSMSTSFGLLATNIDGGVL